MIIEEFVSCYMTFCLSQGVERVVFVGNYLCGNVMSMQMLAYAMEYWSQGQVKALFLRHEGYFGALGCLLNRLNSEED